VRIEASKPATAATTITQRLVASHPRDFEKRETLRRLITEAADFNTAIVFANRKTEVQAVPGRLAHTAGAQAHASTHRR
jgi:superfamily II DNA/RNA helicase